MQRGRSGLVVLTKRGATPYLVVASLLNRFGLDQRNHGGALQRPSGIIPYLVQCGVKLPGSVEQQMSSALPLGNADAQSAEQRSRCRKALNNECPLLCQVAGQTPKTLNNAQLMPRSTSVDGVDDYEKAIGAPSQGIVLASTLWDKGRGALCEDYPAVTLNINRPLRSSNTTVSNESSSKMRY